MIGVRRELWRSFAAVTKEDGLLVVASEHPVDVEYKNACEQFWRTKLLATMPALDAQKELQACRKALVASAAAKFESAGVAGDGAAMAKVHAEKLSLVIDTVFAEQGLVPPKATRLDRAKIPRAKRVLTEALGSVELGDAQPQAIPKALGSPLSAELAVNSQLGRVLDAYIDHRLQFGKGARYTQRDTLTYPLLYIGAEHAGPERALRAVKRITGCVDDVLGAIERNGHVPDRSYAGR